MSNSHPNIIVIILDTLREDYSTPLENMLTNIGFLKYENVISTAPWTIPSHASIFTGEYPAIHGAHETKHRKMNSIKLTKNDKLLSQIMKNEGYTTYLLSSNALISPYFGFNGFDFFIDTYAHKDILTLIKPGDWSKFEYLKKEYKVKNKTELIRMIIMTKNIPLLMRVSWDLFLSKSHIKKAFVRKNWPLDKGGKKACKLLIKILNDTTKPKFIFMNLMEVHEPYSIDGDPWRYLIENYKTNTLNDTAIRKWKEMYPKEVTYVTNLLEKTLSVLNNKGVFENSLIILTSDHGQLLGEHGRIGHGTFLYDETLRVPLFIKYPKEPTNTKPIKGKYLSLRRLYNFIIDYSKRGGANINDYYENFVFAETYGTHVNVGKIKTSQEHSNINNLEKYRIAVYHNKTKGIFNVNLWNFEKVIPYGEFAASEEQMNIMKNEIIRFIKTHTLSKIEKLKLH